MNFVILGCGRVGSRLAVTLDEMGHKVTIIDYSPEAFKRLPDSYKGDEVLGMGIDEDILRQAGIEEADVFAAVTNGDNTNIMAAHVAKEIFQVPRVIARIYDPIRAKIFAEEGLETICPTTLITEAITNTVLPERLPLMQGGTA